MKTTFLRYSIFVLVIGLLMTTGSIAQDQEFDVKDYKMLFNFSTVKNPDNTRLLEASLIARNKKDRKDNIPLFEAEIEFVNTLDDQEVSLGKSKTSKEGIATLVLPENQSYLSNSEGSINLIARFNGSEALDEEEEEISVKDLHLEMNLTEIDSVRTVVVNAFVLDSLGSKLPVEETDIVIAVGGMLSKMPIGDGTIEDGEFILEMPNDIPGDRNGDLTVYSIIKENDEFGDVIQKKTANWGIFNAQSKKDTNTLWSEAAPIWMYVVLTILLVGVWANYVYTIINLLKIKKEGKQLELEALKSQEV
ncbi:hypothetical protein [Maribacter arenosus]|uniref:Oxygen tolerance n=1 Tax=Maribacter arenosus TaxID=1854708 RepID=A0ABR7VBY0_9FLAO|nr:hypothetical protein [Maribacter arenosus]MBD0851122.1 hypothetical protein [Maribacter arenosus]